MPWAILLQSEYRRVKKATLDVASTNPIILVAIVGVSVGSVVIAVRLADVFAILSVLPGGASSVTVFLLLIGLIVGISFALLLPKEQYFDEQFQLVPVRKAEIVVGLRIMPFVLMVGVTAVPLLAMTWRLYALVGVSAHGAWAMVFGLLYLSAAVQGAAVSEALRGYRSWGLFSLGTLALVGIVALSVGLSLGVRGSWVWLATFLPVTTLDPDGTLGATVPPMHIVVLGVASSAVLSVTAWIAHSLRPEPPPRRRRIEFSVPIGKSTLGALTVWATLTTLRESQSRSLLTLAVLVGIGTAVLFSWLGGDTADVFGPLVLFAILYLAAPVVLLFSETRSLGIWLLKTVPVSGTSIGLAWWISTFLLTIAVGIVVLIPSLVGFVRESSMAVGLMFTLIVIASSATLVGRLLPWSRESPARQLFSALAMMVASGGVYFVGIEIGGVVEGILGESVLIVPIAGILLFAATGALSAAIEWLDS